VRRQYSIKWIKIVCSLVKANCFKGYNAKKKEEEKKRKKNATFFAGRNNAEAAIREYSQWPGSKKKEIRSIYTGLDKS